ncbi:MAG: hypothetical protein IJK89_07180 [Clostridia bacterium]|nr:hypothetical protein [Clostridia bacterium]
MGPSELKRQAKTARRSRCCGLRCSLFIAPHTAFFNACAEQNAAPVGAGTESIE